MCAKCTNGTIRFINWTLYAMNDHCISYIRDNRWVRLANLFEMIKSLDANVSLQIGSSQVITSIDQAVKELVENAIDAQTSRIEIYCDQKTIKVTDCGMGISLIILT